ncbi:MAG TPA: hypothetical protein VFE24_00795 [Pirellulales bacterium]|jgi:hypothetical protein|nr:hypothetical protein [Pirellulales bacterium]
MMSFSRRRRRVAGDRQTELFDGSDQLTAAARERLADQATSRLRDPPSSLAAAARSERSGIAERRRRAIVAELVARPFQTYREIAAAVGLEPVEVGRRLNDLERGRRVEKGAIRDCGICGSRCLTWRALPNFSRL